MIFRRDAIFGVRSSLSGLSLVFFIAAILAFSAVWLRAARVPVDDPCWTPRAEYWLRTAPELITPYRLLTGSRLLPSDRISRAAVIAPLLASGEAQFSAERNSDSRLLLADPLTRPDLFVLRIVNLFMWLITAASIAGVVKRYRLIVVLIILICAYLMGSVGHAAPYVPAYILMAWIVGGLVRPPSPNPFPRAGGKGSNAVSTATNPSLLVGEGFRVRSARIHLPYVLLSFGVTALLFYAPPFWIVAVIALTIGVIRFGWPFARIVVLTGVGFAVTLPIVFGSELRFYPVLWSASVSYPVLQDESALNSVSNTEREAIRFLQARIPDDALLQVDPGLWHLIDPVRCPMGANIRFRTQPTPAGYTFTDDLFPMADAPLFRIESSRVVAVEPGVSWTFGGIRITRRAAVPNPVDVEFGDQFYLIGSSVPNIIESGKVLDLQLAVQFSAEVNVDSLRYGLFIHVIEPRDPTVKIAEWSGDFISRTNNFAPRRIAEYIPFTLFIPEGTAAGDYEVIIGFYDFYTNVRLPIRALTQPENAANRYAVLPIDALRIGVVRVE